MPEHEAPHSGLVSLDRLNPGESATLHHIAEPLATGHGPRLAQLGVRVGAGLTVVQRTPGRGVVVSAGFSRYCLDNETAHALLVSQP